MQDAGTVLAVLRERGRKGLPCEELYRQMFNKSLYLLAYGRIYANRGAMTPGVSSETADGMSEAKIEQIIAAMRGERYRFAPVRRVYIPKASNPAKLRPLGIPVLTDRCHQARVRNALEPEWEARFEPRSYGFRPGRGCHDAIEAIYSVCKGPGSKRAWILDADLAAALDPWSYCSFAHCAC